MKWRSPKRFLGPRLHSKTFGLGVMGILATGSLVLHSVFAQGTTATLGGTAMETRPELWCRTQRSN
jgi:hypothetical protein